MHLSKARRIARAPFFGVAVMFSVAVVMVFSTGTAYARHINIVNNLDVTLYYKDISREHIQINSEPPRKVDAGTTGSFSVSGGTGYPKKLHLHYYVGEDGSSFTVGIRYKHEHGDDKEHCSADHPQNITQDVKHCTLSGDDAKGSWEYIYTFE